MLTNMFYCNCIALKEFNDTNILTLYALRLVNKKGFIKTTDHRPIDYRLTNPPILYPPTYVKTEDQILNMFCIL